jgi:tetratricopeptide (TPR) repeat protein
VAAPLLQLDLFGGPATLVVPEPPAPAPAPPPPEPPLALPGQLSLEDARSARLAPLFGALEAGRFADAAAAARLLRGEQPVALALDALAAEVAARPDAAALAGLELPPLCAPLSDAAASSLGSAAVRGRALLVATALESQNAEARAQGELAAVWWLAAGRPERAFAAFDALLAAQPHHSEALLLRANALHARGEVARARADYRLALRAAPERVRLDLVADAEVRLLALEAEELELSPVEPWLPFVGLLAGLFPLLATKLGRAPTPADRFEAALLRCREGRNGGRPAVESRRELKRLAPKLFAALLEAGLV